MITRNQQAARAEDALAQRYMDAIDELRQILLNTISTRWVNRGIEYLDDIDGKIAALDKFLTDFVPELNELIEDSKSYLESYRDIAGTALLKGQSQKQWDRIESSNWAQSQGRY